MIAGINRKKEQMKERENLVQEEKTTQKRKVESSKVYSKRAKLTLKKSLENVDLQEKAIPDVERIEEPVIPEPDQSLDIILNEEKSPCGLSSEGYSLSPSPKSIKKKENPFLEEINKALDNQVQKINSPLKERDLIQEDALATPKVPIQPGLNRRIQIDPRIQFQEKLEKTRAASVEKVKQSMKPLPSIPVIEIGAGDSELDDLLQVISETKVGSEQAEKMIRLMNQPLDMLQKDPYWNNELVKVTSCLVEQQFPEKYRVQVSYFGQIFENLFLTREKLSDVRLKVAMIQVNSNGLIIAKKDLKEKDALYSIWRLLMIHLKNFREIKMP
ncbi:hypothetical protein PIB30_071044 [Stylosanthes scabra]|uniref:Uncharacterized protein n=1 Tax=Stylosanthes scabra TaxID=79078 RepID=A0ABU6UN11_9FABA|nr:hypothetical protein [Stylosanthes scabra]